MKLIASDVFIYWKSFLETGAIRRAEKEKSGGISQQAFNRCQADKTALLNFKAVLAQAEQEFYQHLNGDSDNCPFRLRELGEITDVKKMAD